MMDKITFQPIGVIHSPFNDLSQMPIQPCGEISAPGTVEILPEYAPGLKDLDGFSHVILIYHFHQAGAPRLIVTPFLDSEPRGVFATRAPVRPNPIGLSVVQLFRIQENILHVGNLDILDGTPLLDLKPFIPDFDHPSPVRIGWLQNAVRQARHLKSDRRFG